MMEARADLASSAPRRQVAILAADVAGYSRLMGVDQERTFRTLTEYHVTIDSLINNHGGRVANRAGDSVIAEFAQAAHAIQCAMEIQRAIAERNTFQQAEARMRLRIGVTVGGVIDNGGDILGDDVNIAARLQQLASPGQIYITGEAYDAVKSASAFEIRFAGERRLKNISRAIRTYRVVHGAEGSATSEDENKSGFDRPSIAVLPFANMSPGPDQKHISDGISADIITELARFKDIYVTSPDSSFLFGSGGVDHKSIAADLGVRYMLEGSVRRAGDRLRISAQLIDADSGAHLWAERYDGTLLDVFEFQEEISRNIVGSIAPEIHFAEQHRIERGSVANLQAYDVAMRAVAAISRSSNSGDMAELDRGLRLAREAVALDPASLKAHYALAHGHCRRGVSGLFAPTSEQDFVAAYIAASRLRELDPQNHAAFAILGHIEMRRLHHDESISNLTQAHRLNPNDATTLRWLAWEECNIGDGVNARKHAELALRLNPRDRVIDQSHWTLGLAHYVEGDSEAALAQARQAVTINPAFRGHYMLLIAALVTTGRHDEAHRVVQKMLANDPGYLMSRLSGRTYFARKDMADAYVEALRTAYEFNAETVGEITAT